MHEKFNLIKSGIIFTMLQIVLQGRKRRLSFYKIKIWTTIRVVQRYKVFRSTVHFNYSLNPDFIKSEHPNLRIISSFFLYWFLEFFIFEFSYTVIHALIVFIIIFILFRFFCLIWEQVLLLLPDKVIRLWLVRMIETQMLVLSVSMRLLINSDMNSI